MAKTREPLNPILPFILVCMIGFISLIMLLNTNTFQSKQVFKTASEIKVLTQQINSNKDKAERDARESVKIFGIKNGVVNIPPKEIIKVDMSR
jgi:hypothetical protein